LIKCNHAQIHRALAQTENSEEFNIFHQHLTHFGFVMRLCATMMCGGPCEWLALSSQNTPGHHFTQNLLASISQRVQFTALGHQAVAAFMPRAPTPMICRSVNDVCDWKSHALTDFNLLAPALRIFHLLFEPRTKSFKFR
jgi:hypothetical protein